VFRTPEAASFERADVRLDAGVREGDAITPFYDPLIAKLIVWGADRAQALARLDAALAQTHIVGPHTNTAFLRRVAASPSFTHAELDTALIERERAALFNAPPLALEWAVAAWVAHLLAAEQAQPSADPWAQRDGWRLHGSARRTLQATWVAGAAKTAAAAVPGPWLLEQGRDGGLTLHIGPQTWALQTASCAEPGWYTVRLGAQQQRLAVYPVGTRISVFGDSGTAVLETQPEPGAANPSASALQTAGPIVAPMPGKLCSVLVATGQTVRAGQALLVLEAMKMEHTVAAPRDGTVQAVLCAVGDAVREGAELLRLGA
jgi:3-methylcrotonyl-CoA carboxylase alpha subunit